MGAYLYEKTDKICSKRKEEKGKEYAEWKICGGEIWLGVDDGYTLEVCKECNDSHAIGHR